MDSWVKLVFLSATGSIFFLIGYLYGEIRAPALTSIELQSMHLNVQETLKSFARDVFLKASDLDSLEREVVEAQGWATRSLTLEVLPERRQATQRLREFSDLVLEGARLSLTDDRYAPARQRLEQLSEALQLAQDRLEGLLPVAVGHMAAANWSAEIGDGDFVVQVKEKPFGAHILRGSTRVAEVFPGFPAHRLGVQPGCELVRIAGETVWAGNWMEVFQRAKLPFEMRLDCSIVPATNTSQALPSQDPERFRVMVVKKPFGMNIQVHVAPRVVEVLPGYPAEAAGVREGFVLTEVNDKPVTAIDWFEAFQLTPLPFTMTFDTTVPVHEGNPFMLNVSVGYESLEKKLPPLGDTDYTDFKCEVPALPFGMQVRAPLDGWPRVVRVLPERPAEAQGVHVGDVLVEVSGLPVNSTTWFAIFQQSAPPFGLKFRRPYQM
mmetsp:Transcript_61762/g.199106  ORF Transcript_61762/g.199106 Transcript_61762/m.199106 type:complete len:436 (+) Transcript_61762:83-1390(+)